MADSTESITNTKTPFNSLTHTQSPNSFFSVHSSPMWCDGEMIASFSLSLSLSISIYRSSSVLSTTTFHFSQWIFHFSSLIWTHSLYKYLPNSSILISWIEPYILNRIVWFFFNLHLQKIWKTSLRRSQCILLNQMFQFSIFCFVFTCQFYRFWFSYSLVYYLFFNFKTHFEYSVLIIHWLIYFYY